MRSRPARRAAAGSLARSVIGVVLAAVALASCATVPTSGPVREGDDLRLEREDAAVPFIATPPRPGASPDEVVSSFLRANADFRDDHFVARQHLTPQARQKWRTSTSTTVFGRVDVPAPAEGARTVEVTGDQVARIDPEGSYRRTAPATPLARSFPMQRVDGEWRIAQLDDGLVLSQDDVEETFRQVSLYFLSPLRNRLVPDTVLLPQLPGLSTKIVSRLLRGPTTDLRGAVETAFPQGTTLAVPSVPVRDGLVTVPLDEAARGADEDARQQMAAQIVWTLKQLGPEIDRVRITAGGEDIGISGAPEEQSRDSWLTFDPNGPTGNPSVYAVRAGAIGRVVESKFGPVPGPAGTGELPLRSPAVSLDESRLAAVTVDGKSLHVGPLSEGAPFDRAVSGVDLGRPSWDPQGNLWFVDRASGAISVLPDGDGQPVPVAVGKLPGGKATRLAVSRDGARVALVTGTGASARLVVATLSGVDQLERDSPDTAKVSLQAAREVLPDLRGVRDVAWADAQTLAVIGSRGGLPAGVMYTTTDGYEVAPVQAETDLVGLAATPPLRPQASPLVIATAEGQLKVATLGSWMVLGEGSEPTFPG